MHFTHGVSERSSTIRSNELLCSRRKDSRSSQHFSTYGVPVTHYSQTLQSACPDSNENWLCQTDPLSLVFCSFHCISSFVSSLLIVSIMSDSFLSKLRQQNHRGSEDFSQLIAHVASRTPMEATEQPGYVTVQRSWLSTSKQIFC